MKLKHITLITIFLFVVAPAYAQHWENISRSLGESSLYHLEVDTFDHRKLLVASEKDLYQTLNGGDSWKKIFHTKDDEEIIRFIVWEPSLTHIVYIGTDTTLYSFNTFTGACKNIYAFSHPEGSTSPAQTISLAINPYNPKELALGTPQGLLLTSDEGKRWTTTTGQLKNKSIRAVSYHINIKNLLFVLGNDGIYTIDRKKNVTQKTFSFVAQNNDEESFPYNRSSDTFLFFSSCDERIVASSHNKMYISSDTGATWGKISTRTLLRKDTSGLTSALDSETIFIAENNGVHSLDLSTLQSHTFSEGLYASHIYDIALHENDKTILYCSTNKGLYALTLDNPFIETNPVSIRINVNTLKSLHGFFSNEPTIIDIQKQAITYANVSPDKTKNWHRRARLRAFMPSFSVDFDKSISNNIDIDRSSTSVEDTYIIGPQEEDFAWGINLEWDFKNLLWNDDETTIDYREKYTFDMRDDILHEITQLFFERRKFQIELYINPPADKQEYLILCVKIDELTAHIDALTGGWFSERLSRSLIADSS